MAAPTTEDPRVHREWNGFPGPLRIAHPKMTSNGHRRPAKFSAWNLDSARVERQTVAAGMASATTLAIELRRRHHRRGGARPRHRLLPGREPRHHQRGRGRQGVCRRWWVGSQHCHRPVQLPDAGRRPVLRPLGAACTEPGGRPQLQRHVLPTRPSHPGPQRWRRPDHALAGRSQQGPGNRLGGDRSRRDQRARPRDGHLGAQPAIRSWAPSTTRREG